MGTDIHGWLEVRKFDNNWREVTELGLPRFYHMFAILADVRTSDETPISKPKGLPEDICKLTQNDFNWWVDDAHSCSWLNWDDLKQYDWDTHFKEYDGGYCRPQDPYLELFNRMKAIAELHGDDNVRIVFWFDC